MAAPTVASTPTKERLNAPNLLIQPKHEISTIVLHNRKVRTCYEPPTRAFTFTYQGLWIHTMSPKILINFTIRKIFAYICCKNICGTPQTNKNHKGSMGIIMIVAPHSEYWRHGSHAVLDVLKSA